MTFYLIDRDWGLTSFFTASLISTVNSEVSLIGSGRSLTTFDYDRSMQVLISFGHNRSSEVSLLSLVWGVSK